MHYKLDVNSHRVTLDCIMRDALEKGVRYKQDVRISLREYGIILEGSIDIKLHSVNLSLQLWDIQVIFHTPIFHVNAAPVV